MVVVEYISFGFSSETFLAAQAFTAEQLKALASVFGNMSFSNDHLSGKFHEFYLCGQKHKICLCRKLHGQLWIIDTGTSDHVTKNLNITSNVRSAWCLVGLPDDKKVGATHEGSIKLTYDITLIHVLLWSSVELQLDFYAPTLS